MAMKKRRSKHEYARQIEIAQLACDWAASFVEHKYYFDGTRLEEIIGKQTVAEWAKQFENN
jgi:uncharacterized metal-binding protein